jgi:hypothetical protein
MVQEDPEMLEIVHQVDEILGTLDEAEEYVLTEDELAHELYGVDNDIEVSFHPAEQEIKDCIDEIVVQYTDPAGNTFEAPVVIDEFAEEDNFDLDFNETEEEPDNTPDFF